MSVGVIGIALGIGAFFWLRRRKTGSDDTPATSATEHAREAQEAQEAPVNNDAGYKKASPGIMSEMDGAQTSSFPAELHGDEPQPRELDAKGTSK